MPLRVTAFEVPADADGAFLAAWSGAAGARLHRALRAEGVAFRFVEFASAPGGADPGFASRAATYDVVGEDGTPDGDGGTLRIDLWDVPAERDDAFLAGWG